MEIIPYRFENIPKITQKELEISRALLNFLPSPALKEPLFLEIRKELIKQFGQELSCFVESVKEQENKFTIEHLEEKPLLALISSEPAAGKIMCQIDNQLAAQLIDKLLGGSELEGIELRQPSETEQGVLQFVVMRVLQTIQRVCGQQSRLHFRFDRFLFSRASAAKLINKQEKNISITLRLGFSDQAGFVKVIIPYSVVSTLFTESFSHEETPEEMKRQVAQLGRFGFVKTALWAEAGRCELTLPELEQLEEGDVILFDDTQLSFHGEKIGGMVTLRVGEGNHGGLQAQLDSENKAVVCKITGT